MTEQEHEPLDTAGQERTAAALAEEERLQREKEQNDLRYVMSSKQGRRFIHRQLSEAGIWRLSFNAEALTMAFNEGQRNAGLKMLSEIMDVCPERYTEMLTEQKEAKDRNDNRHADRRNPGRARR